MTDKKNPLTSYLLSPLALVISSVLSPVAFADDTSIEIIEVHGQAHNKHLSLGSSESLLTDLGVDFSAAGGMANLPVLNGLMGDRVAVLVDGAQITAACANQMNPPLSYISANQISSYKVIAGISPVSAGGDNIAGVIAVNSISPQYSESKQLGWHSGYVSAQYNTLDNAKKVGAGMRIASDVFSFNYQGAFSDANSYKDGNGDLVPDTLYRAQNHSLSAAMRDDKQQLVVKLSHQKIPYQGFANQYMDMTDNTSYGAVAQYKRAFTNSELEAQLNWHSVKHEMGFFSAEKTGKMPMKTDAEDISTQLKWQLALDNNSQLLLAQEYYYMKLDDWWPAVEGSMMMGPNDYNNINNGRRQRIALLAEYESQLNTRWWFNAGVRFENVITNTDDVQAYNAGMAAMSAMAMAMPSDAMAAKEFNDQNKKQTDNLVDANVLINYQLSNNDELQIGLARKNRAPNLYERYSWGVGNMATTMIGWYGDGNGYIGNIALKPETAHTLSTTYTTMAKDDSWRISANAWVSDVNDYIDANRVRSFNRTVLAANTRNVLMFNNVNATLYGVKLDAVATLHESKQYGSWSLKANITNTRGKRDDTNQPLYQIKPLQTQFAINQQIGRFENALTWQWVDSKTRVDSSRLENKTEQYHLLNLSSKASWDALTVSVDITNLLDEYYQLPLGGVSIAEFKQDSTQGFNQLAGQGRSINLAMSYAF